MPTLPTRSPGACAKKVSEIPDGCVHGPAPCGHPTSRIGRETLRLLEHGPLWRSRPLPPVSGALRAAAEGRRSCSSSPIAWRCPAPRSGGQMPGVSGREQRGWGGEKSDAMRCDAAIGLPAGVGGVGVRSLRSPGPVSVRPRVQKAAVASGPRLGAARGRRARAPASDSPAPPGSRAALTPRPASPSTSASIPHLQRHRL